MSPELRPARPTDSGTLGEILWRFQHDTPWMPELYSAAETIAFCGAMIDRGWVTVAELAGRVCGFLARDRDEICGLYVAPEVTGRGIGGALLRAEKRRCDRLALRVFEANAAARRFYRREGFVEVARCDGRRNEETLPEIACLWAREDLQ